ncbi:MAG TPA: TolC family protein [Gemmatimonadales bacterium]|nr:TolC family protein [Gemmatimonadales bacterium]
MRVRVVAAALGVLVTVAAAPVAAQAVADSARTLSLDEALRLAEGESETVGIAAAEIRRAEGLRSQARSGYFPQLSGSASYTRTLRSQFSSLANEESDGSDTTSAPTTCSQFTAHPELPIAARLDSLETAVECSSQANPFSAFSNLPFGRENAYSFGLSLSQTLFDGGRTAGQSHAAAAQLASARIGFTAAQAQLLLDVVQAYYDALLADRLVAIAESTLVQADTTLSQTKLAHQVGNQSDFDLLRAQVARDNQVPVVIQQHAARDLAYLRLKQLINLPLDQPVSLTAALGDTGMVVPDRVRQLAGTPGDTTVGNRAPVRQAAQAVEAQEGLVGAARGARLPALVLSSDFAELNYPQKVASSWGPWLSNWTVTLGVQIPIFTGGRLGGAVKSAQASLDQAKLQLEQTRKLARLDTRTALYQYNSARAAWEASQGTEAQAARAYQIAELRYREGISTQLELNDARLLLEQAQVNRAQAARDLQVARIRVALLPVLPLAGAANGAGAAGTPGGANSGTNANAASMPAAYTQPARTPESAGTINTNGTVAP